MNGFNNLSTGSLSDWVEQLSKCVLSVKDTLLLKNKLSKDRGWKKMYIMEAVKCILWNRKDGMTILTDKIDFNQKYLTRGELEEDSRGLGDQSYI